MRELLSDMHKKFFVGGGKPEETHASKSIKVDLLNSTQMTIVSLKPEHFCHEVILSVAIFTSKEFFFSVLL